MMALVVIGILLVGLAFYRDLMDQSFSSVYNGGVTSGLRWVGAVFVVLGAMGALMELIG